MGVHVTVELYGCDGSYFCLSGPSAGTQGVVLESNPQGLWDAPVKVSTKRGAFQIGSTAGKIDRPHREVNISLGATAYTPEMWAEIDSRLRMAFDYEVDPWDGNAKPARLAISTSRGSKRWLDVLLLESPIMNFDTDPWDYTQSSLPVTLIAYQPMWYEDDWVGDTAHPAGWKLEGASSGSGTVWVCNPTDRPMNHSVIISGDGIAHIPDFSWEGPKGARQPGVDFRTDRDDSDRVLITPKINASNGHGLRLNVDRLKIPAVDFTNTNVTALMDGNRLLYQIPPYTPWTEIPVSAEQVTGGPFMILFRQPRLWSRPWGLERF